MIAAPVSAVPCFQRHPASHIHAHYGDTPTKHVNGVFYVADHNNGAALLAVWDAVEQGHEFCLCHDIPIDPSPSHPHIIPHFHTQSGGTTGGPKRIRRSHASWIKSFDVNAGLFGLTERDVYGVMGRLGHSIALYAAFEAGHIGADVVLTDGQRGQMDVIIEMGVTVLYTTPSQLRRLRRGIAPQMRYVFCGGGMLDTATRTAAAAIFPNADIREFYGASETSFITMTDADTPTGSVGRAYPNVTLDIRNATDGIGEVWIQSPYTFTDYADNSPKPDWVSAGEIGTIDHGYLTLFGRSDRMITIADQNVFPERIEAAMTANTGVRDAVVVPVKNANRGHVLHGFITGDGIDTDALSSSLRAQFGPMHCPKTLTIIDTLPALSSGKPDLQKITEWANSYDK